MHYTVLATVKCPGCPDSSADRRINCRTAPANIQLASEKYKGGYGRARQVRAALQELAWRNLKTIGKREWLCPSCVKKVMNARQKCKEKWG